MGINNEYGDDAFFYTDVTEDDDDLDYEEEFTPQDWHDWNSEHLLNMWFSLRQYIDDNHLSSTFMRDATFHNFVEFVRMFSR